MILNNKYLDSFESIIKRHFKHTFTAQQKDLIIGLKNFIFSLNTKGLFIISGYAGTGKSSLIGAIVKGLEEIDYNTCLLAPTGRATKVLSEFSNKKSSTIHRKIYHHTKNKNGSFSTKLSINKNQNTLFIIDESSMIPDQSNNSGGQNLLDDLISYIYSGKKEIENAPVINHTDKELIMLEKLVGRIPPFAKPGQPKKKIYGL